LAKSRLRITWIRHSWPIALAVVLVVSFADPQALNGFRDRPTSRTGQAINQVIASTDWVAGRRIFMPASLYLRFRILFPSEFRDRLRVAVDDGARDWWRDAAVGIQKRRDPLPPPGDAYLLATPSQLRGELEFWDYGVGLPRTELIAWNDDSVLRRVGQGADKQIRCLQADEDDPRVLLVLMGQDSTRTERIAEAAP
jgi:hypothetical protein